MSSYCLKTPALNKFSPVKCTRKGGGGVGGGGGWATEASSAFLDQKDDYYSYCILHTPVRNKDGIIMWDHKEATTGL